MADGDLFDTGPGGVSSEPDFETALRGYNRSQVDKYWTQSENEIHALKLENEEVWGQVQALASQVQDLQMELADLRRRGPVGDVSFRHLGARVEQILGLAEDQAESIRANAVQDISGLRAEAERLLSDARGRAAKANEDFELALGARRAEEERSVTERRAALEAETRAVEERAVASRAEADRIVAHAHAEAQRITAAVTGQLEQARHEAERELQALRASAEHLLLRLCQALLGDRRPLDGAPSSRELPLPLL